MLVLFNLSKQKSGDDAVNTLMNKQEFLRSRQQYSGQLRSVHYVSYMHHRLIHLKRLIFCSVLLAFAGLVVPKTVYAARTQQKKQTRTTASKSSKSNKKPQKGAKICDYRTDVYEHEVIRGEHLGSIAGRYGVRKADLIRINRTLKKNPDFLKPGQQILVCPEIPPRRRSTIEYSVKEGDSLDKIARKYGLTIREVIDFQKGSLRKRLQAKPGSLSIGQKLELIIDEEELVEFTPVEETTDSQKIAVKLAAHHHYHIKRPHLVYGTAKSIQSIKDAIIRYKRKVPKSPQVFIGDISKKGGGPLKGHRSHQHGIDIDVGLVRKGETAHQAKFANTNAKNFDAAKTWALVKAFIDTNNVRVIFLDYQLQKELYNYARKQGVKEKVLDELLQYPRGEGRHHGIVRHWPGHKNHMHVRFRK